ncbi:MAG: omptin family outer membrane protease [bacterium]
MKKIIIIKILLVLLFHVSLAKENNSFSFNIGEKKLFGYTTYHIDFLTLSDIDNSIKKIESELEFPLDVYMSGIKLEWNRKTIKKVPYFFSLDIWKNTTNPKVFMKDSDWKGDIYEKDRIKFSYTESNAKLNASILNIKGGMVFSTKSEFTLETIAGYKYQNFSYKIFGIKGWYINDNKEKIFYDGYWDTNVLNYEIFYYIPYLGFNIYNDKSLPLFINAEIAFSPFTSIVDHDDHILRNKIAEGETYGTTVLSELNLVKKITIPIIKKNLFAKIGFEFIQIYTTGKQSQIWYGDDPAGPENETGLKVEGINDKIISQLKSILFLIELKF